MHSTNFIYLVNFILFYSFIIISTPKRSAAREAAHSSTAKRVPHRKLEFTQRLRECRTAATAHSTAKRIVIKEAAARSMAKRMPTGSCSPFNV